MIRLHELREEQVLNMSQMAQALNMKYTTYISYEKGEREPNSELLIKFAKFFDVSIDYLIGFSDIKKPATVSDGINGKYEEIKDVLFQLNQQNSELLKEQALVLLRHQESQDDQ